MKNTLFVRQLKTSFNRSKVATAAKKHNLRLSADNPNYDPELSVNNLYFRQVDGKLTNIKSTPENMQILYAEINHNEQQDLETYSNNIEENEQLTDKEKKCLSVKKAKLKTKIKGWIDSGNTTEAEKIIYSNLQNSLNGESIESPEAALAAFSLITDKISRRNDKISAIESMAELMKLNNSTNRNYQLKIRSTEYVFKIPDKNEINISAKNWAKIVNDFVNKNYKDYKVLMLAIHADENPSNIHPHVLISGLNQKTKQYDLPNHDMRMVKNYCIENNIDIDWHEVKNWNEMSKEQHKRHGEIFQDFIFEKMNGYTKTLKYEANFVKTTPAEKAEKNHKYQTTISSTKKEHNRQNKVRMEVKQEEKRLKFLKEETQKAEQEIKLVSSDLEHFNKHANTFSLLISKMSYFVTGAITSITKWVSLGSPIEHPAEREKTKKCNEMVDHFSQIKQIAPNFDHLHCANSFINEFTGDAVVNQQMKEIFDQTIKRVPSNNKNIDSISKNKIKF